MNLLLDFDAPPSAPPIPVPLGATDGRDTRNASYRALAASTLTETQEKVLRCIQRHGPVSNRAISERLDWPVNCVTGRVVELRQKGRVERAGTVYDDKTNRNVATWRVAEETR